MNISGLVIAIISFLIIGLFHPIVIKAHYYCGTRCWWVFLVFGLISIVASLLVANQFLSTVLGVIACSFLWSILELFEQEKRVQKGWFPRREQAENITLQAGSGKEQ